MTYLLQRIFPTPKIDYQNKNLNWLDRKPNLNGLGEPKNEFPDMGLSPRNLWDMKRFYERYYQADIKLRQAVAVLP